MSTSVTARPTLSLIDGAHALLMLSALAAAYVLPFELVLLSYAILGPLHYLTEISWLHERDFFLQGRWVVLLLLTGTGIIVTFPDPQIATLMLFTCLLFSVCFALFKTWYPRLLALSIGLVSIALLMQLSATAFVVAMLLPTIIHVSLFTLIFMISGALLSRSLAQYFLVGLYLVCLTFLIVHPPLTATLSEFGHLTSVYFGGVGEALGKVFGQKAWPIDARLAGLLSFVYTYHYLNWFIKVRRINWHRVPKARLSAIAVLSFIATGLYFHNYALGYTVLFSLSLLHVVLEFPLNALSIRQLFTRRQA